MAGRKSPIGTPLFRLFLSLFFAAFMILAAISPAQSATITVTNTADSGDGSLRKAILDSTALTNVIDAQGVSGTIILSSSLAIELGADEDLTILGPSGGGLTVSGNNAVGVFAIQAGTVTLSNLTIQGGSASSDGGGIYNAATLTLNNCKITGNVAVTGGGGIYNAGMATLHLNNCTVSGNSVSDNYSYGGGIYNIGTLTQENCTVSGNSVSTDLGYGGFGGGIHNNSSLELTNCTVSGNSAPIDPGYGGYGGGISNGDGMAVTLTNCTVTQNAALGGAGLYSSASVTEISVKNTILSDNTGGSNISVQGETLTSQGYNLVGTDASSLFTGTGDISSDSPGLSPLADNGGPTWTHALLETSPALDAGTNVDAPSTDQRGESRPQDGNSDGVALVDIGAYEFPDPSCVGNVAPIANGQSVTGLAGETQVSITLSGSDDDGPASLTYEVVSDPAYGNLTGDPPDLTYERGGLDVYTDNFTFRVYDGCTWSDSAVVDITFPAPTEPTEPSCEGNVAPIANGQTVTGSAGETQVSITLSGSDEDGPTASLTYEVVSDPDYGNLTGTPPDLTYERGGLDVYTDSFTFLVNDGCADSLPATVNIEFPEPTCDSNPPPTAHAQYAICSTVDKFVQITLSGYDQEDETLTYEVVSDPSHGTLTGTPPALTYNWDGGGATADSFTFRVNDGCHNSSTATVNVEMVTDIASSNAPAVAHRKFYDAGLTGSVACTLSGYDFDGDPLGDPLTYEVVEGPWNGTLSGTAPNLIYQTDLTSGTDIFYFRVMDNRTDIPRFSEADSVYIYIGEDFKVTGLPPVADAGPDQDLKRYVRPDSHQAPSGNWNVTLDGSKTYDPAGRNLTYHWNAPGLQLKDGSFNSEKVYLFGTSSGSYTCTLTVTNSDDQSAADSVKVKLPAYDSLALALLAGFCALVGVRYVRRGARENGQDKT